MMRLEGVLAKCEEGRQVKTTVFAGVSESCGRSRGQAAFSCAHLAAVVKRGLSDFVAANRRSAVTKFRYAVPETAAFDSLSTSRGSPMAKQEMRYNPVIADFQRKRGDDSIAFFVPFLTRDMDLLDVGCGPGTITAGFANVVRTVIGLDLEPKAIAAASQMNGATDHGNLRFLEGDMTSLPFDDASFDAVFFHAVLYHLDVTKLQKTLAEALRVLKPCGLLATRDTDVGGNVIYPETSGILLSLDLWQRWYEHSSTDAVYFGRRQGAVLRSHGFVPVWSGASYVNHSADALTRRETVHDAKRSLEGLCKDLVQRSLADREEIDTAISAWELWGSDPDAVYLRCRCECVARKS